MSSRHRVVVIGGGFAGLYAVRRLRSPEMEVTLIDKRNFHLFQPLLYQVATGGLAPGDIASPLRAVLRKQKNVRVLLAEATDFDLEWKRVILDCGEVAYDTLVVAAGAETSFFGHPEWEAAAPGLKTVEDAIEIRHRVLLAFEAAEREQDPQRRRAWLRFVIVGGGPTGVELAGALGEIANDSLKGDFRSIRPEEAEILLLDMAPRVLTSYTEDLSREAERSLIRLGVRCILGVKVTRLDSESVTYERSDGSQHTIQTQTAIWAAGVKANPLAARLAEKAGIPVEKGGRIPVEPDLTLPGYSDVYVVGDMAHFVQDGSVTPGVAPVAMQQGSYVAKAVQAKVSGKDSSPFVYHHKGDMATIGRAAAVAMLGPLRLHGLLAWLLWLFIHLMYLVGFENRVLVFIEWAFHYYSLKRRSRLITGSGSKVPMPEPPGTDALEEPKGAPVSAGT